MSEALNGSRTTTGEVAGAWLDGGWKASFGDAIMRTLATPKRMLVRGEGCRVWDVDGNEYLDFLAGIAVNALGHAHPALVEAVSAQVATLAHVSNYFSTPSQLELAQRLREITGAGDRGRVGRLGVARTRRCSCSAGSSRNAAASASSTAPDALALMPCSRRV